MAVVPYDDHDDPTMDDLIPAMFKNENDEKKMDINGIFGIPYQFLATADRRISLVKDDGDPVNLKIGRKYMDKIYSRMPLLFLTPCKQKFMEGYNTDERNNALASLTTGVGEAFTADNVKGKYYTTQFAYDDYYATVKVLISTAARFLGIGDQTIYAGKTITDTNWANIRNSNFRKYFAANKAVVYYVDGMDSFSESYDNSSTTSSLASGINGYSDQAKEIQFLLGGNKGGQALLNKANSAASGITSGIDSVIQSIGMDSTGSLLNDLATSGVSTILTGGKMIFPKMWSDSGFNRSYDFSIKLRSPDNDSLSIFLNIIVPYLHMLGLVLPHSIQSENPNAYATPYLVRAYCKGMFNVDMGMISSMSVTRGAQTQWNDDGLPTQMDINISIEDLYNSLVMNTEDSENKHALGLDYAIANNTSMLDFLSNLVGLNVADEEFGRFISTYIKLLGDDLTGGIWQHVYNRFDNNINNFVRAWYDKNN